MTRGGGPPEPIRATAPYGSSRLYGPAPLWGFPQSFAVTMGPQASSTQIPPPMVAPAEPVRGPTAAAVPVFPDDEMTTR